MDACKPFVEDLQNNIRNLTAYRDNIKLLNIYMRIYIFSSLHCDFSISQFLSSPGVSVPRQH